MNNAGGRAELPPRKGRTGEVRGGGPFQRPCLPLADALCLRHVNALLVSWIILASSSYPRKFIPAKIKHRHYFPQNAKFNTTKIRTLMVCRLVVFCFMYVFISVVLTRVTVAGLLLMLICCRRAQQAKLHWSEMRGICGCKDVALCMLYTVHIPRGI